MHTYIRTCALMVLGTVAGALVGPTSAQAAPCVSGTTILSIVEDKGPGDFTCKLGPVTYQFSADVIELATMHRGGPEPVLNFSASGNTHTLTWDRLNFSGDPTIGLAFGYTYVADLPYTLIDVTQTFVQTPATPEGRAYSTWNGFRSISGNWISPTVLVDTEPFEIFANLATLKSLTHHITLGCAYVTCTFPPPGTPETPTPAPLPGSLWLALLGLGLTAVASRRRATASGALMPEQPTLR
jgi:hypothetical protein